MGGKNDLELVRVANRSATTVAESGVDQKLKSGGYTHLMGPFGCSMLSTLRMIAMHESVTGGAVVLAGRDALYLPPRRSDTAMVFRCYPLLPHFLVRDNVALARALIRRPQMLLLDEPLSALDPFLRIRMRAELRKLHKELVISFMHVKHGHDEAFALPDGIVRGTYPVDGISGDYCSVCEKHLLHPSIA